MTRQNKALYRGRFAPSPTGPLHLGSLVAAVGSYLQARSQTGQWLLRIEDIDPPREVAGATDAIMRCLEAHGLQWDESEYYQSQRSAAYDAAIDQLMTEDWLYACTCSRKQIAQVAKRGVAGMIYPGTCRTARLNPAVHPALRLRTDDERIVFRDQLQGETGQRLATEIGDFLLKRPDGLYSYQLAVVVDDADKDITEVVRGYDLLPLTPAQIYLQRLLGLPTPRYLHLPILVNGQGNKLSKQTGARPVDDRHASENLFHTLKLLNQTVPGELEYSRPDEILAWATAHWNPDRLPESSAIRDSE